MGFQLLYNFPARLHQQPKPRREMARWMPARGEQDDNPNSSTGKILLVLQARISTNQNFISVAFGNV